MIKGLTYPLFLNSDRFGCSYLRMYKSGSSTVTNLFTPHSASFRPAYPERAFTMIRNPYARALSIYREMRAMRKEGREWDFVGFMQKLKRKGFYDKHQLPQTFFLKDRPVMHLFPLEDREWMDFVGVKEVEHKNVRARDPQNTEMPPEAARIVEELYEKDLELYATLLKCAEDGNYGDDPGGSKAAK